ncbi:MAG: magnesium transporter CorA family protein, partial [Egibacteraceae bacterium]
MLTVRHIAEGRVAPIAPERLAETVAPGRGVVWVDMSGDGSAQRQALGDLGIDEWVAEDVLQTSTHPKAEHRRGYCFAVVDALDVDDDARHLVNDIADRLDYVSAQTESLRAQLDTAFEHHQSSVANAQNEVMKVLTMVSVVLLPISVIAGIYGMNFAYMPELRVRWAYPLLLIVFAAIVGAALLLFRTRGWIGGRRRFSGPRTLRLGAGRVVRAPAMGAR